MLIYICRYVNFVVLISLNIKVSACLNENKNYFQVLKTHNSRMQTHASATFGSLWLYPWGQLDPMELHCCVILRVDYRIEIRSPPYMYSLICDLRYTTTSIS